MGQVFLAVSASVWNLAGSAPWTVAVASTWIDFIDHPASALSKSRVAFTSIRSGRYPAFPSSLEKAIAKQLACAAATSSSGFVPGSFSNRIAKPYATVFRAPLAVDTVPFPSFRPPLHWALARRCIGSPRRETRARLNVSSSIRLANDEMGIAKLVPKVPRTDCFRVSVPDPVDPHEGREQREVARHRIMEPREQAVDRVDPAVRIHEEPGEARAGPQPFGGPCGFQGPHDRGPDRDHSVPVQVRAVHRLRCVG